MVVSPVDSLRRRRAFPRGNCALLPYILQSLISPKGARFPYTHGTVLRVFRWAISKTLPSPHLPQFISSSISPPLAEASPGGPGEEEERETERRLKYRKVRKSPNQKPSSWPVRGGCPWLPPLPFLMSAGVPPQSSEARFLSVTLISTVSCRDG